jgi:cell division protein FtsB
MLTKIKNIKPADIVDRLSDVRMLGLLVFTAIALLVTWSGIKVVQTNYGLQKQIATMQQENELRKLENSNLALGNEFLSTNQYLELSARKQYNKGLPGEKLLIVPKSVAMSHTVDVALPEDASLELETIKDSGPWYERNFNAWIEFIFRRES